MKRSIRSNLSVYIFCGAVLAAAVFRSAAWGQSEFRLEPLWRSSLGTAYPEAVFRLAVCPDGGVYFSDALGRVALLDRGGQLIMDSTGHEKLRGVVAIACDAGGAFARDGLGVSKGLDAS